MSRYTTQVRFICEQAAGLNASVGCLKVSEVIAKAVPEVFDFDFPLFDENYRQPLCEKILLHYYTREIGLETVGLWKLKLETKLREIMPYYNQLYKSQLLEFNPFYDVDLTRQRKVTNTGNTDTRTGETRKGQSTSSTNTEASSTDSMTSETNTANDSNSKADGSNKELYSDTPQGAIDGLESGTYLTNATLSNASNTSENHDSGSTKTENSSSAESGGSTDTESTNSSTMSGTSTTDVHNLEEYIETVKGKQGSTNYSELLQKFRETFLNIDMMIIKELEELFFQLWEPDKTGGYFYGW